MTTQRSVASTPHSAEQAGSLETLNPHQTDEDFLFTQDDMRFLSELGDVYFFDEEPVDEGARSRKLGLIEHEGYAHLVVVTKADPRHVKNPKKTPVRMHFPGWTEVVDGGTGLDFHDALALHHPDETIVSVATDGVNLHGEALPVAEAVKRSFAQMAKARLLIAKYFAGNSGVKVDAISMGCIPAVLMAELNLLIPEDERINIEQMNFYSSGVVATGVHESETFRKQIESPVERIKYLGGFFLHVGADFTREAVRHPLHTAKAAKGYADLAVATVKEPRIGLAITGNFINMQPGVPFETLKHVAEHTKLRRYSGERDSLKEDEQWQRLKILFPQNVTAVEVPGKGHAMSVHAGKTVALAA